MRSADQIEASLDIEWAGGIARNATILYVYSGNVLESLQYAVDQRLAPVVSMSYGTCENGAAPFYRALAQQANAEGITWINSSGDSGAAGCDDGGLLAIHGPATTFPADIPEVTAVGGTEFNEGNGIYWSSSNNTGLRSALSYIPEKAWNDTPLGYGIAAGGGGASALYGKPSWQTGPGVPNDGVRDVPDVSLAASGAHDGYVIFTKGGIAGCTGYFGIHTGFCRHRDNPQSVSRDARIACGAGPRKHESIALLTGGRHTRRVPRHRHG